ncbi:MAG: helix-turn-helix domain-containing protein [Dethiobacteria bacterium]
MARRGKDATRLRRAQIVVASAQGISVPDIARLYH